MPRDNVWTGAMIARFRELHADDGLTFSGIAAMLAEEFSVRLSKNACIGKGRRLGLKERPRVNPPPPKRKKRTINTPQLTVLSAWKVAPPPVPPAARGKLTIYQLRRNTCRYPFGERVPYSYCGEATKVSSSWCPHHERVVWGKKA